MTPIVRRKLILPLLAGLGLLLGPLIIYADAFAPTVVVGIGSVEARHDDGFAYTVLLEKHSSFLFELRSDDSHHADASGLILFEDGKSLGPAHSSHAEIRRQGAGRFSHWTTTIWFSSSDGTDPRANGRSYQVEAKLTLKPGWQITGFVAFGAGLLPLLALLVKRARTGPWSSLASAGPMNSNLVPPSSRAGKTAVALTLFVGASSILLYPLLDRHYLHVFEADALSTVNLTLAFASGQAIEGMPKPGLHPQYFDTQYVIYALAFVLTRFATELHWIDSSTLPTTQSMVVFAIRHTNLLFHAVGAGFAFLLYLKLSRHFALSAVLAAFILFSPHMLAIDFLRIDHIVMALFITTLYMTFSVVRLQGERPWWHVIYGAATAGLILTKVTSVIFLVLPASVYAKRLKSRGQARSGLLWFSLSFVVVALLLLIRFLPHEVSDPGFTARIAIAKVADLTQWNAVISRSPLFFYNLDQFGTYGPVFFGVFLSSLTAVVINLLRRMEYEDAVLFGSFLLLSFFGALSFKYSRGLYVLAPLYLAVIARAARVLEDTTSGLPSMPAWITPRNVLTVLLLIGLYWPLHEYARVARESDQRAASIVQTRLDPLIWLDSRVPPASRIAVFRDSDWANPPLDAAKYTVASRFLDFPYLDKAAMGNYRPPTLEHVLQTTDAIVLNSFHEQFYMETLSRYGLFDLRNEWEQFLSELRSKFVAQRFSSDHANYGVNWTEVILIR